MGIEMGRNVLMDGCFVRCVWEWVVCGLVCGDDVDGVGCVGERLIGWCWSV